MSITLPGGLLVAIEGIDGAGKTTVAHALAGALREFGADVVLGKEPTQGPWGRELRASAQSGRLPPEREAELLVLDRREHVAEVIAPALAAGKVVVLDRYFPSMVAYQGAEGLDPASLLAQNDFAPRPDVLLLLDLAPAEGLARIHARGDTPNKFETPDNLERCRAIFLSLGLPGTVIVDASQPADDVALQAVRAALRAISDRMAQMHGDDVAATRALMAALPSLGVANG